MTESFDMGEVVPMPTLPLIARKSEEVPVRVLVPLKYGNWPVVPEYRDEVAMESVGDEPPTKYPIVPPEVRPRPNESDEVATLCKAPVSAP